MCEKIITLYGLHFHQFLLYRSKLRKQPGVCHKTCCKQNYKKIKIVIKKLKKQKIIDIIFNTNLEFAVNNDDSARPNNFFFSN